MSRIHRYDCASGKIRMNLLSFQCHRRRIICPALLSSHAWFELSAAFQSIENRIVASYEAFQHMSC